MQKIFLLIVLFLVPAHFLFAKPDTPYTPTEKSNFHKFLNAIPLVILSDYTDRSRGGIRAIVRRWERPSDTNPDLVAVVVNAGAQAVGNYVDTLNKLTIKFKEAKEKGDKAAAARIKKVGDANCKGLNDLGEAHPSCK